MHMHVCALLLLDTSTIDEDPYDQIRFMLLAALPKVPLMRKRLATVPFGMARPFWVDDVEFDFDRHLHRVQLDSPGEGLSLAEFAEKVAGRPLRRDRPLWEAWFIEELADDRVALLFKMHHATIDGVVGVEIMGRLFDFGAPTLVKSKSLKSGPTDLWQPERSPSQWELLGRGLLAQLASPLEMASLLSSTGFHLGATLWQRRHGGPAAVKPFTAPRTVFNRSLRPSRSIAFTDVSLADVKGAKEALGVKVNDVLTAIVGGALRRYLADHDSLPDRPLIAAEPVSVHGPTSNVKGVTQLSVIFATLATDVEDPVERVQTVAAANERSKTVSRAMGPDTFAKWTEIISPNVLSLGARLYSGLRVSDHLPVVFNLVLSNVAGPPSTLYLAGAPVVGLYAFGPVTEGAGLNVTAISAGSQVGLGIVTCPAVMPNVWDLAEAIPVALDELTAAVGRSARGRNRAPRRPRTA